MLEAHGFCFCMITCGPREFSSVRDRNRDQRPKVRNTTAGFTLLEAEFAMDAQQPGQVSALKARVLHERAVAERARAADTFLAAISESSRQLLVARR